MAKEFVIEDIISKKAFDEVKRLSDNLLELKGRMGACIEVSKQTGLELGKALKMNPTTIDQYVEKLKFVEEQDKKLANVTAELSELQKKYNGILKQVNKEVADSVKHAREKADLDLKLAKAVQAQEKAEQAKYQTLIKEVQAEKALNSAIKSREVTEEQVASALVAQAKSIKEAQIQNRILREAVRELDQTLEGAAGKMDAYNKKIVENENFIDKSVDSMTARKRNIGNYASAFNGLGMSVQQVVRELPSAAVGLNTFFLAISNNLPILADEITRARQELKLLNEQGMKGTPVWKQLVSSLLSWQTAMVAGITILSMHGKEIGEWIMNLFKGKERIDVLKESLKVYNETLLEGGKNAQGELTRLKLLYGATQDVNKSSQERLQAIGELQKQYPAYFTNMSNEDILAGKAADSYAKLTSSIIASAKAKAAMGKIAEEQGKILENEQKINEAYIRLDKAEKERDSKQALLDKGNKEGFGTAMAKLDAESAVIMAETKIEKIYKEIAEYRKAIFDSNKLSKELEKSVDVGDLLFNANDNKKEADDYAKYMSDIENQITQATINAITNRKEREIAEINKEYDDKEKAIKGNSDKEKDLREWLAQERAEKIKQAEANYERDILETNLNNILAYTKEGSEAQLAARIELLELQRKREIEEAEKTGTNVYDVNKKYDKLILDEKQQFASKQAETQLSSLGGQSILDGYKLNEELRAISDAYKEGELSREEYERKIYDIRQQYAEKSLRLSIDTIKQILSEEKLSDEDRLKYEQQLSQMELELDNKITDNKLENDKREAESERKKIQQRIELMQQVSQLLGSMKEFGDQLFQNKIDQLDKENEANQESYDEEIERIENLENTGAITKEEAEARKRAAEDKTKQKEEEIAKKKSQLQQKQAIYDKTISISQAGIATALAITKALPDLILAGIVAAMGAAQIATIMAQPIPKYKDGTDYHKGGLAIVGDGGQKETIVTPDGNMFLSPDYPVFVNLPKGTQVIPNLPDEIQNPDWRVKSDLLTLLEMRKEDGTPVITVNNDFSGIEKRLNSLERNLMKAFNNMAKESRKAQYESFKSRI